MNNQKKWLAFFFMAFFCLSLTALGQEEEKTLRLAIGDAKLKNKFLDVIAGEIYSAGAGKPLTFPKMIKEMEGSRFIYVGESHDSMAMHDIQFRIVQALYEKEKNIAIGLEMLPVETQPVLDKWSRGELAKDDFIREVKWYVHWNMNFGFYEKIFDFAKENRVPIVALNVPREIITKIRMKGWDGLSEEEKALVPRPDLSSEEHKTLIRAIFGSSELPHQMKGEGLDKMFEGLYRAQAAWDEVMAASAIKGEEKTKGKMIVLAGSGHLLYNLGINARVYEKNRLPFKTVVVVSLDLKDKRVQVARSLANFIYGIAEEARPAFPSVGLALKKCEGLENLVIERNPIDGVALGCDFQKGDIVLSVDGKPFADINELRIYLARFKWDEEARFRLLRNGETKDVVLKFQFKPEAEGSKAEEKPPADKMKMAMAAASSAKIERLRKSLENAIKGAEGEVGVAVRHLESGQALELNGGVLFPMASAFKVPVLVEVLAQVKEVKFRLDDEISVQKTDQHLGSGMLSSLTAPGLKLSVRNLINLMMMISDNSATDIMLEKVGAENVTKRLKQFGIEGISVNRTCQELIMDYAGLDYQKYKGLSLDQFAAEFQKREDLTPEARQAAVVKFSQNPEDQSTPLAMNLLLEKIFKKEILDPESCDLIVSIMLKCQTGEARIKGDLPPGTAVAHKTGTIAGTVNDAGVIYLPDSLGHVVLTVFTKNFIGKTSDVEKIIAEIARLVYDYFYFTS
jgi:beta-lactamase class A